MPKNPNVSHMEKKGRSAVPESKKEKVAEIKRLAEEYPIIGIANLESLPAKQLQQIKGKLRDKMLLYMGKKSLIEHGFESAKKEGIKELLKYLKGVPALIFTKENPFKIVKILNQNKSKAAAKPGQLAPGDIMINAGPTPFAPGPVIGQLGAIGLKTGVEAGKIVIKEDKIIVKEGQPINADISSILMRLGIEPIEIGLNVTAFLEKGVIYTKDILSIDEKQFLDNIAQAHQEAFNLAVEISYPTKDTVDLLLSMAFNGAKALALEANILEKDVIGQILAKAEAQAASLKGQASI